MKITLKVGLGTAHPPVDLELEDSDTIETIQEVMWVKHQLDPEWQKFFIMNGTPLRAGVPLSEYGVKDGGKLLLLVKMPHALRVFVDAGGPRAVTIDVWEDAVVHDIKIAYQERFAVKPSRQSLFLGDKELRDPQMPLKQYGVKKEDKLELRFVSDPMEDATEAALEIFEKGRRWIARAIEQSRRTQAILFPSPEMRLAIARRQAEEEARARTHHYESLPPPSWMVFARQEDKKDAEAKEIAELVARKPPPRLACLGPAPEPMSPSSPCFGEADGLPLPKLVCDLETTAHFGVLEDDQQDLPVLLQHLSSRAFPNLLRDGTPKGSGSEQASLGQ